MIISICLATLFPDRFSIENHRFIRLTDSLNPSQPRNPAITRCCTRAGSFVEKKKDHPGRPEFRPQVRIEGADTAFYPKKGNTYYPVNNTRSLHALKDKSRDVKKFIRSNGLSVRKDRENTLIKVSAWYDNSSPQ